MSGFEMLLVAQAAGTVLQTAGAMVDAETDSKIARNNAIQTRAESVEEAGLLSAEGRRRSAAAKVRAASSGLSLDGSALDVIGELEAEGEYRARTALHEGRVRYDGYRAEQKNAKSRKTTSAVIGASQLGATMLTAGMNFGSTSGSSAALHAGGKANTLGGL